MTEENFEIYRSTNKTKMPDDGLIEYEGARFRISGADFGIIHLSEINRWMGINPAIQFDFFRSEKEALKMAEDWKERMSNALIAEYKKDNDECPPIPKEFTSLLDKVKHLIPSRHPGRLPTISISEPTGGIWSSSFARSIPAMQPLFIPGGDFGSQPPEVHYIAPEETFDEHIPSLDTASHLMMYAGIESLGGVMTLPVRCKEKNSPTVAIEGNVPINDLGFADWVLGRILDEGLWKEQNQQPFVLALGSCNTLVLAKQVEQLELLLDSDFFLKFES
jgi:hypothetical protein